MVCFQSARLLLHAMSVPPIPPPSGRFHGAAASRGGNNVYVWGSASKPLGDSAGKEPPIEPDVHAAPPLTYPTPPLLFVSTPLRRPSWLPSNAELIAQLPLHEVEVLPKQPSISHLLSRLPPTLRQGLKDVDPQGELPEKDNLR